MKYIAVCLILSLSLVAKADTEHLRPINPYDYYGYKQAIFRSLLAVKHPIIWAVEMPSFSPKNAIIIYSTYDVDKKGNIINKEWNLQYNELKKNIEYKSADMQDFLELNKAKNKSILIEQKEFQNIANAFLKTIEQTRYPKRVEVDFDAGFSVTLDGTGYFFSAFGLSGETHSPKTGAPKKLVELASLLKIYINSNADKQNKILLKCNEIANELLQ